MFERLQSFFKNVNDDSQKRDQQARFHLRQADGPLMLGLIEVAEEFNEVFVNHRKIPQIAML